jgi:pyruvate,water dikinase
MSGYILPLTSKAASIAVAGGKGANLGALIRAGFPVPPGFVITTAAYGEFVSANGLGGPIAETLASLRIDDPSAVEAASQVMRDLFDQGAMPEGVAADIRGAYRQLTSDSCAVAVRSSATVEDLPRASFAGQQATYLGLRGQEAVLRAVRGCWSGLWSAQALAYGARRPMNGAAQMAVVIQRMVPADAAGVLFTANPVNGNRDELVVNVAWGLGEAIVGGRVMPDTLVLDKSSGSVLRAEVGEKGVMTVMTSEGIVESPVEVSRRGQPVLSAEQAAHLARLGNEIETHFGTPQDVEWAIAGDEMVILQARPITALPDFNLPSGPATQRVPGDDDWPARGEWPAQPFDLWTQTNVGEVWPHPVSPLLWSVVPAIVSDSIHFALRGLHSAYLDNVQWAKRFYGRIYYNEGALAHVLSHELGLPGSTMNRALGSRRSADSPREGRLRPIRLLRRLPFLVRRAASQLSEGRALEALFPQIDRWTAEFSRQELDGLSDRDLWASSTVWMDRFMQAMNLHTEMSSVALTTFGTLEWLMARWFGRKDLAHDLVTGLAGVHAAEMGRELWHIARTLDDLGLAGVVHQEPQSALAQLRRTPEAQPAIRLLTSFLERHGHRCPNEGEWLYPRWAEAPEQLIEVLGGYLRAGEEVNIEAAEARQRRRHDEALLWVGSRLGVLRRALFRYVLGRVQLAVRLRDNGKNYYMKAAFPLRRIAWQMGVRWSGRSWLAQPEDVFFLTIHDIERLIEAGDPLAAGFDLPQLAANRRRAFEHWSTVEAPEVIGADGTPVAGPTQHTPPGSVLHGLPASSGRVRGTARLIREPRQAARLRPGDILVTRATDPGWTPVFPLVSGLVTEVGGQLSHMAIIAREYGVPAVVNVRDAMRQIQDGTTITVDGTAGEVHLIQDKEGGALQSGTPDGKADSATCTHSDEQTRAENA